MAEQPAEQAGQPAGQAGQVGQVEVPGDPSDGSVATAQHPPWLPVWHRPRPTVVVKADLLPAVSILSFVALLGMVVGRLWSLLAPPERKQVQPNGSAPLLEESYHRFDDLAVFLLLCLGAGLVTGLGVWFLRERRGPVVMVAAVLVSAAGSWLAMQVGVGWAQGRFPVGGTPAVGDIVSTAPVLESAWGILAWPFATALVYGVLAAWNGMDDLGRRLS